MKIIFLIFAMPFSYHETNSLGYSQYHKSIPLDWTAIVGSGGFPFMKKIKLTQGKYALVDDEDFEFLNQWKWYANKGGNTFYAIRNSRKSEAAKRTAILMHRIIMKADKDVDVDHRFGNGLDNRKINLRLCTHAQNMTNRKSDRGGTSKHKGVSWCESQKRWRAVIGYKGKLHQLGNFMKEKDAAITYNEAAKKYHKEFANLNKI